MTRIILIFCILFLVIATTLTKNSTKKIDKQIFDLTEDIRFLNNNYELAVLEHNYLSSPKKLLEYQKRFFENELSPIDIDNMKQIEFKNDEVFIEKIF
tara:strand:- start:430 stop:723 length:294 start_codon:yes stop_codon:yes gene_type:complete